MNSPIDGQAAAAHNKTVDKPSKLTLTLLMLWVLTNNANATLSLNNLALFAHRLYRRSNFHLEILLSQPEKSWVLLGYTRYIPKNVRIALYKRTYIVSMYFFKNNVTFLSYIYTDVHIVQARLVKYLLLISPDNSSFAEIVW